MIHCPHTIYKLRLRRKRGMLKSIPTGFDLSVCMEDDVFFILLTSDTVLLATTAFYRNFNKPLYLGIEVVVANVSSVALRCPGAGL